jgi:hypothetical protein
MILPSGEHICTAYQSRRQIRYNTQEVYHPISVISKKGKVTTMTSSDYGFEETMVTLVDEDGLEKDFYVDEIYEVDGKIYAAVIPSDVENITEYYVFRLIDLGNDDFEMEDIDDEQEYDAAADAYEEILDTRAWNRSME